jgi:predicted permease
MKLLATLRSFAAALLRRSRMERDMDREMAFHLDARAADLVGRGMMPAEAARRAREEFGDVLRWKEEGREARGLRLADELLADLRYAARTLRRSPGFALAAILSLALGIGANTAIFSLLDVVLLRPLPVRDPRTLVQVMAAGDGGRREAANMPWFREVAGRRDLFSDVFAIRQNLFKVEVDGLLEHVTGQFVTGTYYRALGVRAVLGRTLHASDQNRSGINPVAVISYGFWQRRFGGDPAVIGRSIIVDRDPYTIVGVTPPEFFGQQVGWTMDVTMPFIEKRHDDPALWSTIPVVARLNAGVERVQAEAQVDMMFRRFVSEHARPGQFRRRALQRAELAPFANGLGMLREEYLEPLTLLMIAVAILLLIACVNLAGLLLARNAARQREGSGWRSARPGFGSCGSCSPKERCWPPLGPFRRSRSHGGAATAC